MDEKEDVERRGGRRRVGKEGGKEEGGVTGWRREHSITLLSESVTLPKPRFQQRR